MNNNLFHAGLVQSGLLLSPCLLTWKKYRMLLTGHHSQGTLWLYRLYLASTERAFPGPRHCWDLNSAAGLISNTAILFSNMDVSKQYTYDRYSSNIISRITAWKRNWICIHIWSKTQLISKPTSFVQTVMLYDGYE